MKKIYLAFSCVLICAVAIICKSNYKDDTSIALANIEALGGGESSGEETVKCYCKTHWFSKNVCSAEGSGAYCGGDPCSNHDGNCR